jgi:hypothetical protein
MNIVSPQDGYVRGGIVWTGVFLIVVCGLIYLVTASEHFEEATYLDLLFLANFAGAAVTAYDIYEGLGWGWTLGALVASGAFVGYVVSRTTGVPGMGVDKRLELLGILSLLVERLFVGLYLAISVRRRTSVEIRAKTY